MQSNFLFNLTVNNINVVREVKNNYGLDLAQKLYCTPV